LAYLVGGVDVFDCSAHIFKLAAMFLPVECVIRALSVCRSWAAYSQEAAFWPSMFSKLDSGYVSERTQSPDDWRQAVKNAWLTRLKWTSASRDRGDTAFTIDVAVRFKVRVFRLLLIVIA